MALRLRAALASPLAPILANLTVRENLIVPLVMRDVPRKIASEKVARLLATLDLVHEAGKRADLPPTGFSVAARWRERS
jgi:ABC-type sugar transport system ATPase subunit